MQSDFDFYINVFQHRDKILVNGYKDGKRQYKSINFKPSLYFETNKNTNIKTLDNKKLEKVEFDGINEYYNFLRQNTGISNVNIYGCDNLKTQWISENFPGKLTANLSLVRKAFIDIETCCELGFPDPNITPEPINAITYYDSILKCYYVFTVKEYSEVNINDKECVIIQCENEKELLLRFVSVWCTNYPDIISGWNCLNENSSIWLKDKIVKLANINYNQNLLDSYVVNKSPKNIKDEYLLSLKTGQIISCSKDHKFPCYVKQKDKYTNFRSKNDVVVDLNLEQISEYINNNEIFLQIKKHENTNEPLTYRKIFLNNLDILKKYKLLDIQLNDISDIENYLQNNIKIVINFNRELKYIVNLDDTIPVELCQCLGLIYTDGTYSKKRNTIRFCNKNLDLMFFIANCLDKFKNPNRSKKNSIVKTIGHSNNKECFWYDYEIGKSNLFGLLLDFFILNEDKKTINVENLSQFSTSQFDHFFAGCIDGDGYVCSTIGFCNYNQQDIYKIQELLTWNGILCNLKNNNITIRNIKSNERFKNLNLIIDYKRDKLSKCKFLQKNNHKQIASLINLKETDEYYIIKIDNINKTRNKINMYDIETNTHYFYTQGVRTHNCEKFDIPYIIGRINKVLGERYVNKLSPFGVVREKEIPLMGGKKTKTFKMIGIVDLDYLDLYKTFSYSGQQPSYSLKFITTLELGETKLDHEEFANMHLFYRENYQKFIEYNIQDVKLLVKLDEKRKLVNLVTQLAYIAKINFNETFSPVATWESLIYNFLKEQNIFTKIISKEAVAGEYTGAFVKQPVPDRYKWVVSFDLNSLYPSLIRQFNISPEKIVSDSDRNKILVNIRDQNIDNYNKIIDKENIIENIVHERIDTSIFKNLNISLSGSGYMFKRDSKGFLPSIMEYIYNQRRAVKKEMLMHQENVELIKAEIHKRGLKI